MKAVKVAVSTAMHDVSAAPHGMSAAPSGVSAAPSGVSHHPVRWPDNTLQGLEGHSGGGLRGGTIHEKFLWSRIA